MFRRFRREFRFEDPETKARRRIPAGWAGEVDKAIALAADEDGATFKEETSKKVKSSAGAAADDLAKAEIAVVDAEKLLAEASANDKKAAQEKLDKARADLADLKAK